jgi:hypothetical protein
MRRQDGQSWCPSGTCGPAARLTCDCVRALRTVGYTPRRPRLLRLVLRCGNVCVSRQYASVAGIAPRGRRRLGFFARLMRLDAALITPDAASYAAPTDHDLRGGWRAVEPVAGPLFVVFVRPLERLARACQAMVREELESPLTDDSVQGSWRLFLRRREGATSERSGVQPLPGVAAAAPPRRWSVALQYTRLLSA